MSSIEEKRYELVLNQAKKAILFAIRKYASSLDEKEDIYQDCCLEIWRYLEKILSIETVKARNSYIITCCHHICIRRYQKIKKYEKRKIIIKKTDEEKGDEFFENCYFKTEINPESVLLDKQINYFLNQLETAKLLIKILKI